MQRIAAIIKSGDTGPLVGNLQVALAFFVTRKIIGALDPPNQPTAAQLKSLAGKLKNERAKSTFGAATKRLVQILQLQRGLGDNLNGVVEEKTAALINQLLKQSGALDNVKSADLRVRGQVSTAGKPVADVMVVAIDKDLRKEQWLGTATTDTQGRYQIAYQKTRSSRGETGGADVIVRVFRDDPRTKPLAESPLQMNVGDDVTVDLVLPGIVISEWETVSAGVKSLLAGQGRDDQDLPEEEITDADLNFIRDETGFDKERLRLWALAFAVGRSAAGGKVAPAILYGWFRLGLPTEPDALWATTTDKLVATLADAISQAIVPSVAEDSAALSASFERIKLDRSLQSPAVGTAAPLSDLLATLQAKLKLNADQQRVIAGAVANLRPNDPQLVDQIKQLPGFDGDAAGVARTLRLGALTAGHLPLVSALQSRLDGVKDSDGTLAPLAAVRPDEWVDLAYTYGAPEGMTITPAAYAGTLSSGIEEQHPHAALVAHFKNGRRLALHPALPEVGTFLNANPDFDIAAANINAIKTDSKIDGVKQPDQLVEGLRSLQRMNALGANWDETAGLLENDIYSPPQILAAGPTRLAAILDGRIPPARAVALHGQAKNLHDVAMGAFTAGFSALSAPQILPESPLGSVPEAQAGTLSSQVAQNLASRKGSLAMAGFKVPSALKDSAGGSSKVAPTSGGLTYSGSVLETQPTLQALFGSQDSCVCGHCNSVLGPAAYFVDLLQFIENAGLHYRLLGRSDVTGRRPDLQDIELSCSNTDTEVPAIDLALEILENAVALPLVVDLSPGTTIAQQLPTPATVGDEVQVGDEIKKALKRTVRSLPADVRGTREDTKQGVEWTVVDGHRRWRLKAREVDVLQVSSGTGPMQTVDMSGQDLSAIIAGLDNKSVARGAETAIAKLLAPNQVNPPTLANYNLSIKPLEAGKSWSVQSSFAAQLTIDANTSQHILSSPAGEVWSKSSYNPKTIAAAKQDLARDSVPALTQILIAQRFPVTSQLAVKPAAGAANQWSVSSIPVEFTLNLKRARITITSLAYQSGDPNADDIAEPENHNPEAYLRLKGDAVVFPWSLPVDLPLEEVRLLLARARCPRRRLIELLSSDDQSLNGSSVFAFEVLGLSAAEGTLISTEKSAPAVYDCWGMPTGTVSIVDATLGQTVTGTGPLQLLQNVSILLQQSRLSFVDLQAILATQFAQGGKGPLAIVPANTCQPSAMTIAGLTAAHLDRLHRFTRLWRKLDWTVHEVDLAIQALGGTLTLSTLIGLGLLHRLKRELDMPLDSLVGGLSLLEIQPWTEYLADGPLTHVSLYSSLFQRETLRSANDFAAFALPMPALPTASTRLIQTYAAYIGACLGVKASVVQSWVSDEDGLGIGKELNLDNLSRLATATSLCSALNIDPEKLTLYLTLYGVSISPFEGGMSTVARAAALLQFVKRFRAIEQADGDVETLRYLLRLPHESIPSVNADLDEKQLVDLSTAAHAAAQSIPDAPDQVPPLEAGDAQVVAVRVARENAVIAALATGLNAAPELVDDLLRLRLQSPLSGALFGASDFTDVPGLLVKLRTQADPISAYLWGRLSAADKATLTAPAATLAQQQTTLAGALNKILQGPSIYQAPLFTNAKLSAQSLALSSGTPAGADLVRLNRLLLEDAYATPLQIAKRLLPPDMAFFKGDLSQPVKSLLVRLYKSVSLCGELKLSRSDLSSLRKSPTDPYGLGALDFNVLPAAAGDASPDIVGFEQLMSLRQLRRLTANAGDLLRQYAGVDFTADTAVTNAQQVLADAFAMDSGVVKSAADALKITTPEQHRDPVALARLVELLAALTQLGATIDQVGARTPAIATDPSGFTAASPSDADAGIARQLLRAKYGDSQWHDLIKPISDKLRERQRDALVGYLVNRDQLRDANDLYERYLIDVQTGSCLRTTRLLQATGAVQTYIQRVLLNLEGGAKLNDTQRELWDWMHQYRVWEANRKVFLYPENWLLPELRDDKTAIFGEMEGALTQQEQSAESTRNALLGYLEEFADLAQIGVIAMYQEDSKLYVVGRIPNQGSRYFWRSCENFGNPDIMAWTGWESLDLDSANDFIMPFVMAGDLHLAWPVFNRKVDEKDSNNLLWNVQIAWTRRTSQGWVKRKLGSVVLSNVTRLPNKDEAASFVFRLTKEVSRGIVVGKHPVVLETIHFHCYSAHEVVGFASSLDLVSDPPGPVLKGTAPDDGSLWNVGLRTSGAVYRYAIIDTEKTTYSRPFDSPVSVTLTYDQRQHDNLDPSAVSINLKYPTSTNPADGSFNFAIDIPKGNGGNAHNDGEGIETGSKVSVEVGIPSAFGGPVTMGPVTLGGGPGGDPYFKNWNWKFYVAVEDAFLKDLFKPDRLVRYVPTASFLLESGRDLRLGTVPPLFDTLVGQAPYLSYPVGQTIVPQRLPMDVAGNRFISQTDPVVPGTLPPISPPNLKFSVVAQDSGNWIPPRALEYPLVLSLAPVVPGVQHQAWYVQDKSGAFYVQNGNDGWHYWADGQPYASAYRTEAIVATGDLFQPDVQSFLHSDTQANTFQRQNVYANYDWELFLHVPLAIADHFARQQRFEDARRWLHAIFDPTTSDWGANNTPQVWRFLAFQNMGDAIPSIATLLTWLADPTQAGASNSGPALDFGRQIDEWKANPFMPHVIARLRPSAYQWQTFFAYLDVLIGWGDQFFRRDTRESVNDAALLYVLAAKLLGPRPRVIPPPTPPYALTYRLLAGDPERVDILSYNKLDQFSNAWINYADLPGIKQIATAQNGSPSSSGTQGLTSLTALAFCVPQNDKITEYYDTLENRLFNVRHCRNIDGVFRDLPLYDPPIDPLLLIRARAAGLDIDSVLGMLYAPLPNYRFSFTLQKAIELTAELKALGGALLTALEKQDVEALTLLRSTHEIALLKMVRDTRQRQIDEAGANIDALQKSADAILERFGQYQKLLGKSTITKDQAGLPVVEQSSSLVVATDASGDGSGMGLIRREVDQFGWAAAANTYTQLANTGHLLAGIISLIPDTWTGNALVAGATFGGTFLSGAAGAIAKAIEMLAVDANYHATQAGMLGGYERRQDEWVHQSKMALAEFTQIQQQLVAAAIRKDIAERELSTQETQVSNAQEVDDFMRGKFSSQQLYSWMSSQVAEVYFRTYQLALDQAQRAERTYRHELGLATQRTQYIQTDNWDTLKRGLLAGEHLHTDLKRMESAYLEQNVREFEITKHVSLLQLDPGALIQLKENYTCTVDVPEALFDLDFPGHYMRRIKMVNLTIPCVAGPYASVSATLQLIKSKTRFDATGDTYNLPDPDIRFTSTAAAIMAIVTSSAQQDSGMFEPSLRDERYLPFEGAGAVSTWKLSLPEKFRPFDYDTISDVVLHIRYTARDGGDSLKTACVAGLDKALNALKLQGDAAAGLGLARLFSLRHEFPTEWYRFLNPPATATTDPVLTLSLGVERFPFIFRDKTITISAIQVFVMAKSIDFDATTLNMTLKEGVSTAVPLTFTGTKFLTGKEKLAAGATTSALANWKLSSAPQGSELGVTAWLAGSPHGHVDSQVIYDIVLVCRYTCAD